MTLGFKNVMPELDPDHVIIESGDTAWTVAAIAALADELERCCTAGGARKAGTNPRCLLICDGSAADYLIYIAAVLAGISVAPYSAVVFRSAPSRPLNALEPAVVAAPRRFHKFIEFADNRVVLDQNELVDRCVRKADRSRRIVCDTRSPEGEAYVISTSGSTGMPKFVPISYRNVGAWQAESLHVLQLREHSRFGGTYPLYFDASAMFIFGCLATGCTLTLPDKRDYLTPIAYADRARASHWATVPSAYEYSARAEVDPPICKHVDTLGLGGEAVGAKIAQKFSRYFPSAEVVNLYGPAETTIFAASARLTQGEIARHTGRTSLPVDPPPGPWMLAPQSGEEAEMGELLIGGEQVFRGYLGENSSDNSGAPSTLRSEMFPTGDIFSVSEGQLFYEGRTDNQLKLRGQRITLESLESSITEVLGVTAACCALSVSSDADIDIVYSGRRVSDTDLINALGGVLPLGLRVANIVYVSKLPQTSRGKLDREAVRRILIGGR